MHRMESSEKRMREFDVHVENIDKLDNHIHSLLQYVNQEKRTKVRNINKADQQNKSKDKHRPKHSQYPQHKHKQEDSKHVDKYDENRYRQIQSQIRQLRSILGVQEQITNRQPIQPIPMPNHTYLRKTQPLSFRNIQQQQYQQQQQLQILTQLKHRHTKYNYKYQLTPQTKQPQSAVEQHKYKYDSPTSRINYNHNVHTFDERAQSPYNKIKQLATSSVSASVAQQLPQIQRAPKKQSSFQIKLFPCDLTIKTLKQFIANALSKQVELDIGYQKQKGEFISLSLQGKSKWDLLHNKLWERGIMYDSIHSIKLGMFIDQSSHTLQPVNNNSQHNHIIDGLVQKYLQTEQNWDSKVLKILPHSQVVRLGFGEQDIDFERKNYITKEDIACFINLNISKCYKGRQMSMVYERLRGQQDVLYYDMFINKICN